MAMRTRQPDIGADDYLELSLSIWENEGGALDSWWIVAREPYARSGGASAPAKKRDRVDSKALK